MKDYEKKLASHLLKMAADEFGNHGCNDFDLGEHLAPDQIKAFVVAFEKWNRRIEDPDEVEKMIVEEGINLRNYLGDSMLMEYLARRLVEEEATVDLPSPVYPTCPHGTVGPLLDAVCETCKDEHWRKGYMAGVQRGLDIAQEIVLKSATSAFVKGKDERAKEQRKIVQDLERVRNEKRKDDE